MINSIFFDFDGVILDSVNVKTEAFRMMYLEYGSEIADKVVVHHLENGGISRFEKFKHYHEEYLGKSISTEIVNALADQFSELVLSEVISSSPIPGSLEFIKQDTKYKKFIISGTPDNEIKEIVSSLELEDYFIEIHGSPVKKGEHTERCLLEHYLKPENSVFIGDALADYQAAVQNSMKFILVVNDENKKLFENVNDIIKLDNLLNLKGILGELE
jgi:HAD superfamily hydrolase (TIGR01549 family)